jgi:glycine cleavage system regulatory protein
VDLYASQMPTLVLTLLGTDHAGVLAEVSRLINARGGSWERSQMSHLAGTFAGIVELEVPANQVDGLVSDVEGLRAQGWRIAVERSEAPEVEAEDTHGLTLSLVGADHPGIVAEVSNLLAEHGVNIEELSTRVVDAPMAGGYLFEADASVSVPASTDSAVLRAALEALANELMVDVEWHESD